MRRKRTTAVAILGLLVLAGVGAAGWAIGRSDATQAAGVATLPSISGVPNSDDSGIPTLGACTIYRHDSDTRVTYTGESPEKNCPAIAAKWSKSGDYWTPTPHTPYSTVRTVCLMSETADDFSLTVNDSGAQTYGSTICANLAAAGFKDITQ